MAYISMLQIFVLALHSTPVSTPVCEINITVDSVKSITEDHQQHALVYWRMEGDQDTCLHQLLVCGDAMCHKIRRQGDTVDTGIITPWSSINVTLYGDEQLIAYRPYFASTLNACWTKDITEPHRGVEEFVISRGRLDSVQIKYSPSKSATNCIEEPAKRKTIWQRLFRN